jgi:hypothetical protein
MDLDSASEGEHKRALRKKLVAGLEHLPPEYQTPFWNDLHARRLQAFEEHTTLRDSIGVLLQIAEAVISGIRDGNCRVADTHFLEEAFSDLVYLYDPNGDLYEWADGILDECISTIDDTNDPKAMHAAYLHYAPRVRDALKP